MMGAMGTMGAMRVIEQSQDGTLRLPPMTTVRDAAQLRDTLLDLLGQGVSVIVDCSVVEQADLSIVQLLTAARRMAERDGRQLRMIIPSSGALADLIRRSGLEHSLD
ncbi:MAG: STAS domain-containing protein [Rhodospirillaceae bacterium]